jgi:putative tricarboxylic transport membrane protein
MPRSSREAAAEIILGLGIAALGAFVLVETGQIRVSPVYAKVGPRDIPILVGGIMAALGVALAWQGWREWSVLRTAAAGTTSAAGQGTDWLPLAAIAVGLVQQIVLFKVAGFVPTAAVLFFCVAFGFGSRRYLRDILIAIALALVTYVGFVHALGLRLPAGVLEGIL